MTIIIGQLPKLLGIEKGSGDFFEQLWHIITHLGDADGLTMVVGVLSLAVVIGLRRYLPLVPGSLVAVALGVIAVKLFNLDDHGLAIVGPIESGLPKLGLPDVVGIHDYLGAVASAAGIMLVGFAEGLGAAKTYAARDGYEIDPNRELLGLGAANLGAGLSQGMVVNGSLSKTAVNGSAGARTQMSALVVAALTVVTLLFLTSLFEDLPEATLAAIVIAAVVELVDIAALHRALRDLHRPARPYLRGRRPAGLHRLDGRALRRAHLRHAAGPVHRDRGVCAVAPLSRVPATRGRAREGARHRGPVGRSRATSGERDHGRCLGAAHRERVDVGRAR